MPEQLLLINPKKRRKRRKKTTSRKKTTRRRKRNPIRRRALTTRTTSVTKRRRRRSNPSARGIKGFMKNTLMPSATGAAGALGVDVLMGFLPLPPTFSTGIMRPVTKGAAAIGLGMIASMVVSKKMAEQFTAGALTVVAYDTMKMFLQNNVPGLPLSDVDFDDDIEDLYPELAYAGAGATMDEFDEDEDELGAYVDGGDDGMGAYVESELVQ